ncbi:hypothetical protein C8J57DRAFT_1224276 [Mycena rebaudengoi]|nr:hypothetical protein C8J57DRAFT_1224276 [Mycena rebaudengoi]
MPRLAIEAAVEKMLPILKDTRFDEKAGTFLAVDGKFWDDIFSEIESLDIDVNTAWPWPRYARNGIVSLPQDIITHILDWYTVVFRVKEEKKDWVEKTKFLLNICLLCKE